LQSQFIIGQIITHFCVRVLFLLDGSDWNAQFNVLFRFLVRHPNILIFMLKCSLGFKWQIWKGFPEICCVELTPTLFIWIEFIILMASGKTWRILISRQWILSQVFYRLTSLIDHSVEKMVCNKSFTISFDSSSEFCALPLSSIRLPKIRIVMWDLQLSCWRILCLLQDLVGLAVCSDEQSVIVPDKLSLPGVPLVGTPYTIR
jgi:hypothetical protein